MRSRRADVPADLAAVCERCLRKLPEDRYGSCAELAEDLRRFLDGEPLAGHRQTGVWTSISRALQARRETASMLAWPTAFAGAASTLLGTGVVQAAILLDAPPWVARLGLAYYLIAWPLILWGFLVARRHVLNPVERGSTALQFGKVFAAAALLPTWLWLHGGNVAYLFQPLAVVVAYGVFAHGVAYWGRLYLAGLVMFAVAAAMPHVPIDYWPGIYGLGLVVVQVWVGFVLRRFDRQGRAAMTG